MRVAYACAGVRTRMGPVPRNPAAVSVPFIQAERLVDKAKLDGGHRGLLLFVSLPADS